MAAPTRRPHLCGSLPGTAVGAPIGRPSCPVHSAWPSAGGQFCFPGRPVAAPTRSPDMCGLLPGTAVGAPIGRPLCPTRPAQFFREQAILFPAGGRWPPLREVPICAARFPVATPAGPFILLFVPAACPERVLHKNRRKDEKTKEIPLSLEKMRILTSVFDLF